MLDPNNAVEQMQSEFSAGFQAGAASRDAEVAELVRFIKEVAVSTSDHTTTDVIDEALAKVRKP